MRNCLLLIFLTLVFSACKKSNSPEAILSPEKSVLIFPAPNSVCTEGDIISTTQSSILFKWNVSPNTESYELSLKNLITGEIITQSVSKPEVQITLLRSTPFAWLVKSKNSKSSVIAQSDEWKFYNSGPGAESFAPFPAAIVFPLKGQNITSTNGKILLDWEGSDADNDIINYDVYFGTNSTPSHLKNVSESKLTDVSVSPNTSYFWKVITKDAKGNSSDSGIFNFTVN